MTAGKRIFDFVLALCLGVVLLPVLALVAGLLLVAEGRPVFYISERMRTPTRSFGLIKLRTMRPAPPGTEEGVTGGDKAGRMSRLQRFLRRTRADEIPQLWNVIRGDMSLVGPRPPLRLYVEAFPELYARVLKNRPGITGLASLRYHAVEERLLAACRTAEETDTVYRRRCVPRKAALDLIYQRRRNLCWDMILVLQTAARPFRHRG
jgi:lipopolysaccharide/colanic/teichoic acid biosynthesis glycosyltransferase